MLASEVKMGEGTMVRKSALAAAVALAASSCNPAGNEAAVNQPQASQQADPAAQPAHTIVSADQISWASGPPSLPPGAQAAVLHGDPAKDGLFALRLKLPAGYSIAPHTHPRPEIVTVISGTFNVGMGDVADKAKAQRLAAGSFFAFNPGMAHYAHVEEETVVQINSTGPWAINYVNPADDPRERK
ncbi:MAG TPA: cupin domain-containing protein [Xanthobacteraceae bacterium]|nr:cupin domain-containing protein [Xanthobacteraceae bacterium]